MPFYWGCAIIAAGAVVNDDVPRYVILTGTPARARQFRYDLEQIDCLLRVRRRNWDNATMDKFAGRLLDPALYFETFL